MSIKIPAAVAKTISQGQFGRPCVIFHRETKNVVWEGDFLDCIPKMVELGADEYTWSFDD